MAKNLRIRPGAHKIADEAKRSAANATRVQGMAKSSTTKGTATASTPGLPLIFEVLAHHHRKAGLRVKLAMAKSTQPIAGRQVNTIKGRKKGGICTLDTSESPHRAIDPNLHNKDIELFCSRRWVIDKYTPMRMTNHGVRHGPVTRVEPKVHHNSRYYGTEKQFLRYTLYLTLEAFNAALTRDVDAREGLPMHSGEFRAQRVAVLLSKSNTILRIAIDGKLYHVAQGK